MAILTWPPSISTTGPTLSYYLALDLGRSLATGTHPRQQWKEMRELLEHRDWVPPLQLFHGSLIFGHSMGAPRVCRVQSEFLLPLSELMVSLSNGSPLSSHGLRSLSFPSPLLPYTGGQTLSHSWLCSLIFTLPSRLDVMEGTESSSISALSCALFASHPAPTAIAVTCNEYTAKLNVWYYSYQFCEASE